jgi:DNA-binding NtrC family response regulator
MKKTILIVDNHDPYRSSLRNGLKLAGYRVLEAKSRQEAIEQLESKPDLAIVDVRLIDDEDPDDFTGFQLVPEFKGLPVVILTAHRNTDSLTKVYNLPPGTPPPKDFISKMDDIASIVARVQRALNSYRRTALWLRRISLVLSIGLFLFGIYWALGENMAIGVISSLIASALIVVLLQQWK